MSSNIIIQVINETITPIDSELFKELLEKILDKLDLAETVELYVNFVDEKQITELNETYLSHEGPTDVLSFPIESFDFYETKFGFLVGKDFHYKLDGHLLLGDIYICPEFVAVQAKKLNVDFNDEIALLLVHGLLHLLGLDHEVDDEAEFMEHLEEELLKSCFQMKTSKN